MLVLGGHLGTDLFFELLADLKLDVVGDSSVETVVFFGRHHLGVLQGDDPCVVVTLDKALEHFLVPFELFLFELLNLLDLNFCLRGLFLNNGHCSINLGVGRQ